MEEVKDGFPCVLVTLDNNKKHEFLFYINFFPPSKWQYLIILI